MQTSLNCGQQLHLPFAIPICSDIVIITTMDSCSSIIAGCITFGILGNLAKQTGITDIGSVVKGGTGLAFISYPEAIAKFEYVPQVSYREEGAPCAL